MLHSHDNIPVGQINMNRSARHVSVDGQIVIKTCANGYLKYDTYQDIEAEVEETTEKWMTKKTRRNDRERSCSGNQKTNGGDDYAQSKGAKDMQKKRKCEGKRRGADRA